MKHIKRKFLFHDYLRDTDFSKSNFENVDLEKIDEKFLKEKANTFSIVTTDLGEKIFSFIFKDNGKHCLIPVPDFTLVNYNFAYNLNIQRKDLRKKLVQNLSEVTTQNEVSSNYAYDYQGTASSCVICLFTAIECFVNDLIPENFEYRIVTDRKTEIFNKEQIQVSISLMDKLTKVLPKAVNKNFFAHQSPTNSHIYNLRDLRNEIVHTKSDNTGTKHVETLKKLLNFNYDQTLISTFKLFNYYREGYVEECPCSEEY